MKNKGLGFYFAAASAVLAVICLIIMFVYAGKGGIVGGAVIAAMILGILCEAALCIGEKPWSDFVAVIGAVLLAYVMMTVLANGVWNIAESINGIKMEGIPEIAGMNYAMVAINLLAVVAAIVACFSKKSKE